ncbi:cytochrome c biogenesis protein [Thiosulfatimonas sediminis]|uniref:Cytochrome c biogenesis protein n=1 Tax=Thiosulfatimonas sediminis TaxID=2675054 RepID=A0A6F8PRK8_9GAMM|nr:cytochrome c biogenesis protein ResB [Thiosulfatimonas sediminis]BBP44667.1 cytochrome c biogenesis protein [Thiosulfatimonas sediminis]
MSNAQTAGNKTPKKPNQFMNFLGSMNLAVTLLVMLSIASVIGTVLQQNQSFQDYILKFGPFWTEVFNSLGLFQVYGAAWFILVLVFLLISTSVCVSRNGPGFLKDMKQFSEKLSQTAIKHQTNNKQFTTEISLDDQQKVAQIVLEKQGYKTKIHQREDGSVTVAGLKGRWNRLGYIFTHVSIIVICIGALLDSNLLLKYRELTGSLIPETRTVSLDQIPKSAWVGEENISFRGTVNIGENQKSDVLFLPYENGFLVQQLPFTIVNKDFRIQYYDTGMPKTYESDLELYLPGQDEPIRKTIEVNKPLYFENYAIYQSSFGDGGTELKLKIHPLLAPAVAPLELDTAVNKVEPLKTPIGKFRLEIDDFRNFNMVPMSDEEKAETGRKFHNNGPSITFKVRNEQGKAWEYENYVMANKQEGRYFFMTGMRESAADQFRYLFIPADAKRSKARFFKFLALLNNPQRVSRSFQEQYPFSEGMDQRTYGLQLRLVEQLMTVFRRSGFSGITDFINTQVPEAERERVSDYYFGQTTFALQSAYMGLLRDEGVVQSIQDEISDFDKTWFEDALTVISSLSKYGPPMYFEIDSFKQIQATGLQITKSPGKDIVYLGSAMLIIGVFFMFYVRQRRFWVNIKPEAERLELTLAAKDNKNLPETKTEFDKICSQIQTVSKQA